MILAARDLFIGADTPNIPILLSISLPMRELFFTYLFSTVSTIALASLYKSRKREDIY